MRLAALALIGVLAGCFPSTPDRDVSLIWNPTVTMAATSRFEAARFAGDWVAREGFATPLQITSFAFAAPTNGVGAWREVHADGRVETAPLRVDQAGVFTLSLATGPRQMVVLWVDEGFRTAALANRDGRYAAIFDRSATGGADRIEAARVLLRKNGFDVSKLMPVVK